MTQHTKSNQYGFTLIELTIALAFVGFLLIFVLSATVEVVGSYNKGVVIKEINQSARSIVEDMGRVIRSTSPQSINTGAVSAGRVCFGSVSYIWNIQGSTTNKYTDNSVVSFARAEDAAGALCVSSNGSYPAVDPVKATSLVNSTIWVQKASIQMNPDQLLTTIDIRLSTSDAGNNNPTVNGPGGLVCSGGRVGNYCAVAEFSTTVNTRN